MAATSATRPRPLRSIFSGSVGNLIEWYDWYVYAAFSLYFAPAFFPSADPTAQLLNTAAIFAVGFLMRPVGGWLMGVYADRHGRRAALTASVLVMCLGSLLIACTPAYEAIGLAAPALLLFARLLQGLSVGGEYGASATYLSEMAPAGRRGFYSSFQYVTLVLGQLLALALLMILQRTMSEADLQAWGWRIPFAIGALAALSALILRRGMDETDAFKAHKTSRPRVDPLRELARHPRAVISVIGLTLGGTVAFYTFTTYAQKFLVNSAGWTKQDATTLSAAALLVFLMLQPLVGLISDRIGRRPILIAFGVLGTIFTVPIMEGLRVAPTFLVAFLHLLAALVIVSGYTAINAIVKAELFPTEVRAIGVALPYALTVSIFGGSAEYVALWLKARGLEQGFYIYVAVCILVSLVTYALMPETSRSGKLSNRPQNGEA